MQACCWMGLASLVKPCSGDWKQGSQEGGFMQKLHFMGAIYGHKYTKEPENPMVLEMGYLKPPS